MTLLQLLKELLLLLKNSKQHMKKQLRKRLPSERDKTTLTFRSTISIKRLS